MLSEYFQEVAFQTIRSIIKEFPVPPLLQIGQDLANTDSNLCCLGVNLE